jgi:hypothetical protein
VNDPAWYYYQTCFAINTRTNATLPCWGGIQGQYLYFVSTDVSITLVFVVEMISELPDPLNARGGPVKLYRPAISYISICKGLFGPIRADYTRFELKS